MENLGFVILKKYAEPQERPTSTWYDQNHPNYGEEAWWDRDKNDLLLGDFKPDRIGLLSRPPGDGARVTYESLSLVDTSANMGRCSPSTDHVGLRAEFRYN